MASPPPAGRPHAAGRRTPTLLLALLLALGVIGGCARVQVGLVVQPDDTVAGDIVVATTDRTGPQVTVPPELIDEVDITPYRQEDYVGSRLRFSGLSFTQVSQLTSLSSATGDRVRFTLRRVGNRVLAKGTADLAVATGDRADFQLKINFPGDVLESNGEVEARTVTWVFSPGEKGEIGAVAGFVDPEGPSTLLWTLLLTVGIIGVAGGVVWLARQDRNPPVDRSMR